jgi:hypothetical protein
MGIEGKEEADKLAKEAVQDEDDQNIVFDRTLVTTVASDIKTKGLIQWQNQWNSTEKGAVCRSFFPVLERRLKMKIPFTPELTAVITGHRKTKAYLHRFKLADNPMCPCNEGQQTSEHIIYGCKNLEAQRSSLIKHIMTRGGNWPPADDDLVTNYLNTFSRFIKSV